MKGFLLKNSGLIIVLFLGFIPLFPLMFSGLPITHDGQDHVARIANFYRSLTEGNMVPRWAGNLNWGYGHPILMFLYPFPSYLTSGFHALGFPLVESLKIVFGLTFVLSGIFMYLWVRNVFGEKSGIIAGVLYMYAPYRFVDLYVRGAIGEHVAFLFVPLVFYSIYKISRLSKNTSLYCVLLSVSIAGLILSHNAISIMFLPLIMMYAGIHVYFSKNKKILIVSYLIFSFLGVGLSSFFSIPAFFEGKYTLRDIVTGSDEYASRFVKLFDYVNLSWSFGGTDFLSKQIGLVQVFGVIISIFFIKKSRGILRYIILLFGISLVFVLFIMLSYSNFLWQIVTTLQKFQFPWRFLSVVVFLTAALSSIPVLYIKNKKIAKSFVIIICLLVVVLYFPYYSKVQGYLYQPQEFYSGIYDSTTDTGESAPVWSVRFMEKRPVADAEIIDGTGVISQVFKNTTERKYVIDVETPQVRVRENTLYFPNWTVYINGQEAEIEFQDPANRGLITYKVPYGIHNIDIKFEDTKLRFISNVLSVVSFVILLGFLLIYIKRK